MKNQLYKIDSQKSCFVCGMPAIAGLQFGMFGLSLCPYHSENPPDYQQVQSILKSQTDKFKKNKPVNYSGTHRR